MRLRAGVRRWRDVVAGLVVIAAAVVTSLAGLVAAGLLVGVVLGGLVGGIVAAFKFVTGG
jgi:hypothetical protein